MRTEEEELAKRIGGEFKSRQSEYRQDGTMALAGHEETKVFHNYVCVARISLGSARIDVDSGASSMKLEHNYSKNDLLEIFINSKVVFSGPSVSFYSAYYACLDCTAY